MSHTRYAKQLMLGVVLSLGLMAGSANAHVILNDPNGGEVLEVGSVFTIEWQIQISHDLQNWDVWYSTTGNNGPWIEVAMDLAPGSGAVGSIHTYDWTVPDTVSDQAFVRVRMDNNGTDYEDVSASAFSIVPPPVEGDLNGDGMVGTTDLLLLLGAWGRCDDCGDCAADLNGDCSVGSVDLIILLGNWG